jgi:ribosome maturation factor RimP
MNVAEIRQKIEGLAAPAIERRGAYSVDIQLRRERGEQVVQLFVDTDRGITIDECAEISRELVREFELARVFEVPYRLEVSSPGLEKPLRYLRQYPKNVGRRFRVNIASEQGPRTLLATLVSVEGDRLTFQPDDGEPVTLPFDTIIESKEELPW